MQRRIDQAGPNTRYIEGVAAKISETLIAGERGKYELGALIDEVLTGHYWSRQDWPGAPEGGWPDSVAGFKQWCWAILGFKWRKAYYLRANYLAIGPAGMNLNPASLLFSRAMRAGWTKLAAILKVAKSKEELASWLDKIENPSCTACSYVGPAEKLTCPECGGVMREPLTENTLRVETALNEGKDDEGEDAPTPEEAATAGTTITTAGGAMPDGEEVDPETGEPLAATATTKKDGTRVKFPLVFENQDAVRLFIRALDVVKARTDTDSNGEAAARMAAAYLAACPRDVEGGLVVDLNERIGAMEKAFGVRLMVVETKRADMAMDGFGA